MTFMSYALLFQSNPSFLAVLNLSKANNNNGIDFAVKIFVIYFNK